MRRSLLAAFALLALAAPARAEGPPPCAAHDVACLAPVAPDPAVELATADVVCAPAAELARRRVLLIGLDGVRPDALLAARPTHLTRLARTGTASYDAEVADITLSGPSWTALLTGVGVDKHGVTDNAFEDHELERWPTVFEHLRHHREGAWLAAFVAWRPLQRHVLLTSVLDRSAWRRDDDRVIAEATQALRRKDPLLTFVHLDAVDAAGHKHGYGVDVPLYLRAIAEADARVGALLTAVRKRKTFAAEDWLVVVTTDHGGTGFGHKDDLPTNRRIFIIAHGLGAAGSSFTEATPRLTDVAPTLLAYLGVPLDPELALDGRPLVADAPPHPLAACRDAAGTHAPVPTR